MPTKSKKTQELWCPFTESCTMPQVGTICRFPECKMCPEYQSKLNAIKSK
jgi:hypothetical protein